MGPSTHIEIVTFNANEAAAVDALLARIDDLGGGWALSSRPRTKEIVRATGSVEWRLSHAPLMAQGNVMAGASLARHFDRTNRPQFVVFYGCAGAIDPHRVRHVYLVREAYYLALGTVRGAAGVEEVTLKNKWLCAVDPADGRPIDPVRFPLCGGTTASIDLAQATGLPTATVAAMDKVMKAPAVDPPPYVYGGPHPRYAKGDWKYGEALGWIHAAGGPTLVEMESYGIGAIAEAMNFAESVVILRVTTDSLVDHGNVGTDNLQARYLMDGVDVLGAVVATLFRGAVP